MKTMGLMLVFVAATACSTPAGDKNLNNTNDMMTNKGKEVSGDYSLATFGGGCFWCIEAIFTRLNGVYSATSGYAGGHVSNPSYEQVITGATGHAEVVQVKYDPAVVSYLSLLEIFFRVHDPTTLNRQGADVGTQYRSAIFYHDEQQKEVAQMVKERLGSENIWDSPIVTEITPLDVFYRAEDYHQNYFEKNPNQAYCQMVIMPKVQKFKSMFEDMLRQD
ncbi:MAG: peptide-methionine (S)-S-oxide reductase [Bacteroidia bacterium]|nr:MAG: peptide-methionine (S)-S-oxide reductase [Bacteroidia bacterium]